MWAQRSRYDRFSDAIHLAFYIHKHRVRVNRLNQWLRDFCVIPSLSLSLYLTRQVSLIRVIVSITRIYPSRFSFQFRLFFFFFRSPPPYFYFIIFPPVNMQPANVVKLFPNKVYSRCVNTYREPVKSERLRIGSNNRITLLPSFRFNPIIIIGQRWRGDRRS